jgi:hypothetical protein
MQHTKNSLRILHRHGRLATVLVGSLSLVIFAGLTHPAQAPLWLVVLPFLGLFLVVYSVLSALLALFAGLDPARTRVMALTSASLVLVLFILSSVNKVTVLDIAVVGTLIATGYLYIRHSHFYMGDSY